MIQLDAGTGQGRCDDWRRISAGFKFLQTPRLPRAYSLGSSESELIPRADCTLGEAMGW